LEDSFYIPNLGTSLSLPGQEKQGKEVLILLCFSIEVSLLNLQLQASVFAFVVKCQ
jgi:hypothetical protein